MNAIFPLLRLPPDERTHVLKSMDLMNLVSFSLISKATKSLVVDLNLSERLEIYIEYRLEVHLRWPRGIIYFDHNWHQEFSITDIVDVFVIDSEKIEWKKRGFNMEDWLNHLMDITHQVSIESVHFHFEIEFFDFDSLVKIINGLKVITFVFEADHFQEHACSLIDKIPMDSIHLWKSEYEEDEYSHRISMLHFEKFYLVIEDRPTTLNDILVSNARFIWFYENNALEMKKYNRFLKLWKKGFNGRPTVIHVAVTFVPDKNVILKGIEYFEIDPEDVHPMRPKPLYIYSQEVEVYDIHGSGGRKATLYIGRGEVMRMEFCVWD